MTSSLIRTSLKFLFLLSLVLLLLLKLSSGAGLPVISLNQGLLTFNGDVGYNGLRQPLLSRTGLQLGIQLHSEKKISIAYYLLSGKLSAETRLPASCLNFRSSIFTQSLMLRYDFLSNRSDQVLIPYLTAGIAYMNFHTKTDLKDANGNDYHYWSDGTIRSLPENDPSASESTSVIYRDYYYETSVRDGNIYGEGKYRESAFSIPVGAGFRMKLTDKSSVDFNITYHFTSTDYIDGVTTKGYAAANSKNDKFIYTSVGFRFDLSKKKNGEDNNVDFAALMKEDADNDGIPDIRDDSSGTPQHNIVDKNGKPIDADDDGIPDYRDKELNSAVNAVVDQDGVTITEAMVEEKFRRDSLAALPAIVEYVKSYDRLAERKPEVVRQFAESAKVDTSSGNTRPVVPDLYKPLDTDENGVITPKEISKAIDLYLERKSPYTVQQFFDLIDFFFSQH